MASDASGTASIVLPGTYDRLVLKDHDEAWHFENLTYTRSPEELSTTLTIECYRTVDLFFDVFFDDGRPCKEGTIQVIKANGFRSPEYTCTGKHIEVTSVPAVALVVRVRPLEPGYESTNLEVPAERVLDGAVIPLRVPRSKNAKGNVAILLGGEVNRVDTLEIYDAKRGVRRHKLSGVHVTGGRVEVPGLYAGEYLVRGMQDGKVYWAALSIEDGKTTEVAVQMLDPATASVRVTRQDGTGISGAVLRTTLLGYTDFPAQPGVTLPGLFTTTSSDGVAELGGLHSNLTELVVEADGYQHQVLPVILVPGELTSLPDVVLEPAKGKVTVNVRGTDKPTSYEVALLDPNGGTGYSSLASVPPSGIVMFNSVSCRTYLVMIRPVGGGKVVSHLVELNAARTEAELVLDVTPIEKGN